MEHYKDYLIHATARGKDDNWEPRFAIYNADGREIGKPIYRVLLIHKETHTVAVEMALAAAKTCIDEEM